VDRLTNLPGLPLALGSPARSERSRPRLRPHQDVTSTARRRGSAIRGAPLLHCGPVPGVQHRSRPLPLPLLGGHQRQPPTPLWVDSSTLLPVAAIPSRCLHYGSRTPRRSARGPSMARQRGESGQSAHFPLRAAPGGSTGTTCDCQGSAGDDSSSRAFVTASLRRPINSAAM